METKLKIHTSPDESDSDAGENPNGNKTGAGFIREEELSSSPELQDIISHKPAWMVKHGVGVIGLVLLGLLGMASFIHYPDHITTTLRIVSARIPERVIAPCEGKLGKLLVFNGAVVKRNQVLAFIQSTGSDIGEMGANRKSIVSPEDGILRYEMPLQENHSVYALQKLFCIEPSDNSFYGELIVSQAESARIKEGQEVIIKLEKYPSPEYGYLSGTVSFISPVSREDNGYVVRVTLPPDARSSYNKLISYENNLIARSEIITGNQKLLEKIVAFVNPLAERE